MRRFWFLLNQANRLNAEANLAMLSLVTASTSGEGFKAAYEILSSEVGSVYIWDGDHSVVIDLDKDGRDPDFDRAGLHALKMFA